MEALYYKRLDNAKVQCELCPHNCIIQNNKTGICKVRKNKDGTLYAESYAKPVSIATDPIEKKPLYHFNPGKQILSIGTLGCNFKCMQCQNYDISQYGYQDVTNNIPEVSPEDIIKKIKEQDLSMVAYTYNEPTVFYEYMLDIAKLAKKNNIQNVIVSNGFINQEPLKELIPYLDAANIDLKSIEPDFYKKTCGGSLEPVLETIKTLKENKVHIELTNLIIPTLNDKEEQIKELCEWVIENTGADTPIHFSAFYPMYKLAHLPATDPEILYIAKEIAEKAGLKHVHLGNI